MDTCGIYGPFTTYGSRIANKTIRQRKQWTTHHLATNQKVGSSTLSGRTTKSTTYRQGTENPPTRLPTHIALPGDSKVGIARSWQIPRSRQPAAKDRGPDWRVF